LKIYAAKAFRKKRSCNSPAEGQPTGKDTEGYSSSKPPDARGRATAHFMKKHGFPYKLIAEG
jgi:hypothetical protein